MNGKRIMAGVRLMNGLRGVLPGALLLVLLLAATAAWGMGWRVVVKDAVCSTGARLLLGEIADIYGDAPPGLWEKLATRELWRNPDRVGRQMTVSREQLERLLGHYVPEVGKTAWALPSQLTVQYGGALLSRQEIEKRAVAFLTPRAAGLGGEAEFKDFRLPDNLFVDNDYDKIVVELAGPLAPGRVGLRLNVVTSDGKVTRRLAGSVFMNLWKPVPSAAKPLNRLQPLNPEDVTFVRRNVAYLPDIWDGRGGPWRLSRPVGAGQPLTMACIERLPAVTKGERVVLVYQGVRVQMAVKAEALGDAEVGQNVSVRNLQTKKEIVATVVGEHTVAVR